MSEIFDIVPVMNTENPKPTQSNKKYTKVVLLGSIHGTELHEQLHSALGDECAVTSTFKPNAALGDVAADLQALCTHLTKQNHVIIVERQCNNLERDLNHQTEKDLNKWVGYYVPTVV